MNYYNIEALTIVSQRDVIKAYQNTSFSLPFSDETLANLGLCRLANDPRPNYDEDTQVVVDGPIEVRNGVAFQTHNVIEMSDEQKAVVAERKKEAIKATIAQRRYDAEVGGITLDDGTELDTSREVRSIISGAIAFLSNQPAGMTVPWKGKNGQFTDMSANDLRVVESHIAFHVMSVFQKEKELLDALEAGTYTEDMLQEKFPVETPEDLIL